MAELSLCSRAYHIGIIESYLYDALVRTFDNDEGLKMKCQKLIRFISSQQASRSG